MQIQLITRQRPMIKAFSKVFIDAISPKRKEVNLTPVVSKKLEINIDPVLTSAFHSLFNVKGRYKKTIAPHMFPQWVFPELFKLLRATNLPLHKIINQGFKLSIHEKMFQNVQYYLTCSLDEIIEEEKKYCINQKIWVTDKYNIKIIEAEISSTILKVPSTKAKKKTEYDVVNFKSLDSQFITKKFAKQYAQITGDFNPIHLSSSVAKLFGFKTSIMHGFGLMSLLYESLKKHEMEFNQLEMKFIRPVLLNSRIQFEIEEDNQKRASKSIRIKSLNGSVNAIGSINKIMTIS